jgi:VanZ family protein
VHFAAYGVLGILIALRKGLRGGPSDGRPDWFGVIAGMLYAVGDEIHQLFVPFRMFDLSDMAADFLGVALGVWAYRKVTRRASGPASRPI